MFSEFPKSVESADATPPTADRDDERRANEGVPQAAIRQIMDAFLGFLAIFIVTVAAASLQDLAKEVAGDQWPLFRYRRSATVSNDPDSRLVVMFRHGEATHAICPHFMPIYNRLKDGGARAREDERSLWFDPGLTNKGQRDADVAAEAFENLGLLTALRNNPDRFQLLSSPMARAMQTALRVIPAGELRQLKLRWKVNDDLRGRFPGLGSGLRRHISSSHRFTTAEGTHCKAKSFIKEYGLNVVDVDALSEYDPLWSMDTMESEKDAMARVMRIMDEIIGVEPGHVNVIAAHMHPIQYVLALGQNDNGDGADAVIGNGDLVVLEIL